MAKLAGIILAAYVLGALPFSLWLARLWKGIDIRRHGSGNPGATNVFRVLGPVPGIGALLLDAGKGFLAVAVVSHFWSDALPTSQMVTSLLTAVAVVLGHIYSFFLGFKGGKGVAPATGAMLALLPMEAGVGIAIFLFVVAISRYVSLGSLVSSACVALLVGGEKFLLKKSLDPLLVGTCLFLTVVIFYTHRANIRRILAGTEHKVGQKDKQVS